MMDAMLRDSLGMPIDEEKAALQPTQILTPDNVQEAVGDAANWRQPTDALDQYKALWGLQ